MEKKKKGKRKGGSSKGTPFERRVAVRLSEWWSNDFRSDIFWRSDCSGARATSRAKRGHKTANSHGDLAAIDPVGAPLLQLLTIECKVGYSRHTLADLADRRSTAKQQQWDLWIETAQRDAEAAGSWSWAIVAKRDQRDEVMLLEGKFYEALEKEYGPFCQALSFQGYLKNGAHVDVVLVQFEEFLDKATPKFIVDFLKTVEKP